MRQDLWPVGAPAVRPVRRHSRWSEWNFNVLSVALASIAIGLFFGFLLVCFLLGSWIGETVWGLIAAA